MSDAYLATGNHETVLVQYDKTQDQYNQGYRFVWCIQYGKSYVFKDKLGASWGSGVYELKGDNSLGDCVDWNFDSSG